MSVDGVHVHPHALVDSATVGHGTRVWAFAHIMSGARVGRGCNVGEHAFIESGAFVGDNVTIKNGVMIWDGVTIEDDVFIGPGTVFTNDPAPRSGSRPEEFTPTLVRRGASVGANATIVCGVTIGEHAMIGAGTVLADDAMRHGLYVGNPGRRIGWTCVCGRRLPSDLACACGRRFEPDGDEISLIG